MNRSFWITVSILSASSLLGQTNIFTFELVGTLGSQTPSNSMGLVAGDPVGMTIEITSDQELPYLEESNATYPKLVDIAAFAIGAPAGNATFGFASDGRLQINEAVDFDAVVVEEFSSAGSTPIGGYEVYLISMIMGTIPGDFPFSGGSVAVTSLLNSANWPIRSGSIGFTNHGGSYEFVPYEIDRITHTGTINLIPEPNAFAAFAGLAAIFAGLLRRRR